MSDDEARPAEPRPYLPLAAYPLPTAPTAPSAPTWTKVYEHPTARRVVSTGIQLAVDANREVRRASIYIGLLALGAFGPAVLLLLLGIARLASDPTIAAALTEDPTQVFVDQPGLLGPLALVYCLLIAGGVLLIAISIDAQAMAISILGGRASDSPLRLWEAIARARQVFWRLLGASLMVGVASTVVTFVIEIPFIRPFDTNTGLTFIATMIGTLIVMPFAFASTGIVLGDVGATEALRRSMSLFRARPRIALVVTLFTLVTSAIQTFAIGAGADAALRVGEVLHLGLDQGPLPLVVTLAIVLAFIVAFGSLTFTIAAIVAAPQVTAFLGFTYYSGGIDRARGADGVRPRGFRWVSRPMAVAMVGILVVAGLGLPSVTGFQLRPPDPIVSLLRTAAVGRDVTVMQFGRSTAVDDPALDVLGSQRDSVDIVSAGYAYLPEVPVWLLATLFACDQANVACGDPNGGQVAFASGAFVFHQRMSGPPGIAGAGESGQWGPLLVLSGYHIKAYDENSSLGGATHAYVTRMVEGSSSIHLFLFQATSTDDVHTSARSTWIGSDLLTIVPIGGDFDDEPLSWDAFAAIVASEQSGHDQLRASTTSGLQHAEFAPEIDFVPTFAP